MAIWCCLIFGAGRSCTRAGLLGITIAGACSAHSASRSKLAASTAILIGVVAYSITLELACLGITAIIATAVFFTTAIAILTLLDNAIAALVTADGSNAAIVRETIRFHAITKEGGADVPDRARAEVGNSLACGRIHDIPRSSITIVRTERAALLSIHRVCGSACRRIAVMNSAKGVAGLMSNDLPFCRGLGDNVGAANHLARARSHFAYTKLSQPSQAYFRPCSAICQECPIGMRIIPLASPS